jgi:hypothetical protein
MHIIHFDMTIEFDKWRYTGWRKVLGISHDIRVDVLGISHDIRVDVLLIYDNKLYTLDGAEIEFNSLGRSDIWIDK